MRKKIKTQTENHQTFREAMRGVKPLRYTKVTTPPPALQPKLKIKPSYAEEENALFFSDYETLAPVSADEIISFARSGVQHKILRNLRAGHYNIEAILDLHGLTVQEAREGLSRFLIECMTRKLRMVLIIHGKGHNNLKPVLKNKLNHWLRQTEQVIAFCSASAKHGRHGALYLLLRRSSLGR